MNITEKKESKNKVEFLINQFMQKEESCLNPEEINKLDYYYRQGEEDDNPILFVAAVGFHHKKGSIVEFFHPSREEILKNNYNFFSRIRNTDNSQLEGKEFVSILDDILNQLTYFCLPDAVHTTNEDAQFFLIQNYKIPFYGISCYRQLKTNSLEVDDQNTRDCVQKAICIVSKAPLFGLFYSKLESTMTAFFNQHTLKDKAILEELYANYQSISFKNINISEIFMSFSLRKLFMFCKEKIFTLIKLLMMEKKIIVYSHISNNVCSFILSLVSLIPGNVLFNLNMGPNIKNFNKSINMYGLPLRINHTEAKIFPLFTLFDFSHIEKAKSYLIGTTNQMVLNHNKIKYDCVVNIDSNKITINSSLPDKIVKITKEEKTIFSVIYNKLKNNYDDKKETWMVNMNMYEPVFEGSDDFIRNEFKAYFLDFFTSLSLSLHICNSSHEVPNSGIILCDNEEKIEASSDELDDEDRKKKNYTYYNKSLKKILSPYNMHFIGQWTKTQNYQIWLSTQDKNLCYRSKLLKSGKSVSVYYENGDVYNGFLSQGKKSGYGVLNEYSTNSTYSGNWENDMVNYFLSQKTGSGCQTSSDNQNIYDGEWLENKKHGQGQLINKKSKYSGNFKNDMFNGYGIFCDSEGNVYEGDFVKGAFCGMGHYKSFKGDVYIGQFENNLYNGKGQYTDSKGMIYNGLFKMGLKCGEGLLLFPNGDRYEGYFLDDKFEGEGTLTLQSGEIKTGLWMDGEFIKEIKFEN